MWLSRVARWILSTLLAVVVVYPCAERYCSWKHFRLQITGRIRSNEEMPGERGKERVCNNPWNKQCGVWSYSYPENKWKRHAKIKLRLDLAFALQAGHHNYKLYLSIHKVQKKWSCSNAVHAQKKNSRDDSKYSLKPLILLEQLRWNRQTCWRKGRQKNLLLIHRSRRE